MSPSPDTDRLVAILADMVESALAWEQAQLDDHADTGFPSQGVLTFGPTIADSAHTVVENLRANQLEDQDGEDGTDGFQRRASHDLRGPQRAAS